MPTLPFVTYDVFTDTRYAGNPLAIVRDADGLSDVQMQAVAAEFNLFETVFVRHPTNNAHTANIRIFTPGSELPFAGHPTVGTAVYLAEHRFAGDADLDALIMLEEKIGLVRCAVTRSAGKPGFAEFVAPKLSEEAGAAASDALIAKALGLDVSEIGFGRHVPTIHSAGVPFAFVPLASLDALKRISPRSDLSQFGAHGVFFYARLPEDSEHAFRARMFAPEIGIGEDPATGSAAAAFAGVVARFEDLAAGVHKLPIEQGVEMGRPSLIALTVDLDGGALKETRIGGHAVPVSEGTIRI